MPQTSGQELPGVGDGVALEVVAEAEVAEHLEEGVVAAGEADVFEVVVLAAGADALLAGGGAGVVAALGAEEDVLELVHAGVGEEQGRDRWRARATTSARGDVPAPYRATPCLQKTAENLHESGCRSDSP